MKPKKIKIVVASGKGGVGKTMLASSLAMLFNLEGKKVVALDGDVDAPNLALWLGGVKKWDKQQKFSTSEKANIDLKKCNNCQKCLEKCQFNAIKFQNGKIEINPFLCEGCGVCQIICPQNAIKLKKVKNGIINVKDNFNKIKIVSGQLKIGETGSGNIISYLREKAEGNSYDIMIIDSAPGTGCPVIASVKDTNLAILITEPTPSGFTDLKRALSVVRFFQIPYKIVINKWDINKKYTLKIEKEFKDNILGRISYNQKIIKALVDLKPIIKTKLKAEKEIRKIYNKIKNLI